MDGWMDGWMDGRADLRIAYSNQKEILGEVLKKNKQFQNWLLTAHALLSSSPCA